MRSDTTSLTAAAHIARVSYPVMRRLVLQGEIEGGLDDTGHWVVEKRSLAAWMRRADAIAERTNATAVVG